jgi:hypothetical protein
MIKDENELKNIVEQIKATLGLEELDQLEREYNEMYKKLKEKEAKESEQSRSNDEPMFGNH